MRTMFTRLGCTQAAAAAIVNTQGIDSLDELKVLKPADVSVLAKTIRRPGGMIDNPDAGQENQPAQVATPGNALSVRAEMSIVLASYYVTHRVDRISRACEIGTVTLEAVRTLRQLRDSEKEHKDPDTRPTVDDRDWAKTFELIDDHLGECGGELGLPLAYVTRREAAVPAEADDPAENYTTPAEQMIARAPHTVGGTASPVYTANNGKVASELTVIFMDTPAWTYAKPWLRKKDGRRAYFAVHNHFLGPNSVDNQSALAEKTLASLTYNGESKRWDFEKYATVSLKQHQRLENLVQYGYAGIDERTKVRNLLEGIKTDSLDAPKSQILSDPALRGNFASAVSFIKSFLDQKTTMENPMRKIAEVGVETPGTVEVEDRYYPDEEYKRLPPEKKLALREKRKARGHKPGSQTGKGNGNGGGGAPNAKRQKKTHKALKRNISALKKSVKELESKVAAKEAANATNGNETAETAANRNNSALTRQN